MRDRRLERLFERFRRSGDVQALGRVFDGAAPELLRVASSLASRLAEAEDLVRATFLTAIERAPSWDRRQRLMPWLLGVLVRHAHDARRGKRREEGEAGEPGAAFGFSAGGPQSLQVVEFPAWLDAWYARLPIPSASTDAEGRFALESVRAGECSLVVAADGRPATLRRDLDVPPAECARPARRRSHWVAC